MTDHSRPLATGIGLALFSASSFGLNPPLTAYLDRLGIVPVESVFARSAVLVLVTGIALVLLRKRITVGQGNWLPFAGITTATVSMSLCYLSSVAFIPVGLSVTILYTFPLVVLLLSPLLEGDRVGFARLGVALLAFAGVVISIGPALGTLDWRGIALALGAVCSATTIFFCARRLAGTVDETASAFTIHVIGLPIMLAVAWHFGRGGAWLDPSSRQVPDAAIMPLIGLGLLYVCGYLGMFNAVRFAPVSRLTPFYNIEPVVTIAAAGILVGERLSANQYLGAAIVVGALMLSGRIAADSTGPEGAIADDSSR